MWNSSQIIFRGDGVHFNDLGNYKFLFLRFLGHVWSVKKTEYTLFTVLCKISCSCSRFCPLGGSVNGETAESSDCRRQSRILVKPVFIISRSIISSTATVSKWNTLVIRSLRPEELWERFTLLRPQLLLLHAGSNDQIPWELLDFATDLVASEVGHDWLSASLSGMKIGERSAVEGAARTVN